MVVKMTNQVPDEIIEQVKNANDIVDIIGEYSQLKKQGRNYFGLCPFHGEKTPSFSVSQEKQIFHCFGCGKGGNVFTFLKEIESFTFYESLQFLSEKQGIELPQSSIKKESSLSDEDQQVLTANDWLMKLYHHLLKYTKDGKEGYQYLKERGITDEAIEDFQIGYAPNIKDFTLEFLTKKGFSKQLLVKNGILSAQNEHDVIDRFRGRVIFPIRNAIGKTVGFVGRALHDGVEPKYLNSPEGGLFQKSKILFNFDLAKKHIRKENEVILFEGSVDVISAYQAGLKNVVATLGTALTESQAKLLNRYVETVILCYDGDDAGLNAAYKASQLLRSVGCDIRIAKMDPADDPDSFIRSNGMEAFQNRVIRTSDTYMTFYMRYFRRDYNLKVEGDRIAYIEKVLKELSMIESTLEREYYVQELHKEFNLSHDSLMTQLQSYRSNQQNYRDNQRYNRYTNKSISSYHTELHPAFINAEKKLIAYMLQDSYITEKVQNDLGAAFNVNDHKVIATHLYAYYEEGNPPDIGLFMERLSDDHLKKQVVEAVMMTDIANSTDEEIDDYIRFILNESNQNVSIKSLKEKQRIAEQENNPMEAAKIAMQIIEIQKQRKHMH